MHIIITWLDDEEQCGKVAPGDNFHTNVSCQYESLKVAVLIACIMYRTKRLGYLLYLEWEPDAEPDAACTQLVIA